MSVGTTIFDFESFQAAINKDEARYRETVQQAAADSTIDPMRAAGSWDGDTLVVDTTNFTDKTKFKGADENLHLTERFSRVGPETLLYRFTIDDPTAFTAPWTGEYPFLASQDRTYEYACHEGNYGLAGVLSGARVSEKKAGE